MRHPAKFREDRSNRSKDIADFRFSRWRPSAVLDLFYACWDHPQSVLCGLCYCAKFGCNRRSNFDNMQILIFCALSSKMPIHAPKLGGLGDFTTKMGSSIKQTPKGTSLGGNSSHDVQIVKIGPRVRARREPKNNAKKKFKKVYLRNHNTCFSRVRPDHPRSRSATWICLCRHTREQVIYSKLFHRNPFRGFGAPGGQNLAFPITLASRLYNSLPQLVTACTVVQAVVKAVAVRHQFTHCSRNRISSRQCLLAPQESADNMWCKFHLSK